MRDHNVRVSVAGVKDACGLVGNQGAVNERALRRNVAFGDRPSSRPIDAMRDLTIAQLVQGRRREEKTAKLPNGSTVELFTVRAVIRARGLA